MILYHGTSRTSAALLIERGWSPNSWSSGGQCGDPRYLYLTNDPENGAWYAEEKEDGVVIEVEVPDDCLRVDPDDGTYDTVAEELSMKNGIPGSVVATKPLPAAAFRYHVPEPSYPMP
jgi:hypothetical protein